MSENRFDKYPTKRMPSVNKDTQDVRQKYTSKNYVPPDPTPEDEDYYTDDYEYDYEYGDEEDAYEDEEDNNYAPPPPRRRPPQDTRRRTTKGRRPTSIKQKGKSAFISVYIGLLFLAVAICVVTFIFVFQWIVREAPNPNDINLGTGNNNLIAEGDTVPVGRPDIRNITALVTGISTDPRELILLNLESSLTDVIPIAENATFHNRNGNEMTFSQLRVGHLLDINYDARFPEIVSVRENPRAWDRNERTNVLINLENFTISVGHEAFEFNNQTLVLHRGEPFPIENIRPADSVSIAGLGTTAWMIQLDAASGGLSITNADHIINGRITIGNLHPLFLEEITEAINIPEGPHHIVIEGDNIANFADNIVITPGQTFNLDLGNIELVQATVNINTTPTEATVFINGEEQTEPGPFMLDFGEHTIRVEHEGYVTAIETVTITDPTQTVAIALEAEATTGQVTLFITPRDAHLLVNGMSVPLTGESTLLELEAGTHNLTAIREGYLNYVLVLTITPGEQITQTIHMEVVPQLVTEPPTAETTTAPEGPQLQLPIPPPPTQP